MIPDNTNELLLLTQQIIKGELINCNTSLFGDADQSSICVTVKNYKGPGGVSTQLFAATTEEEIPQAVQTQQSERGMLENHDGDDWSPMKVPKPITGRSDDIFFVKGPMGKGLQIEERGIHMAFCAGTGILVYLDLVGHLIIRNSLPFIKHNSMDKNENSLRLPSNISEYQRPTSEEPRSASCGGKANLFSNLYDGTKSKGQSSDDCFPE